MKKALFTILFLWMIICAVAQSPGNTAVKDHGAAPQSIKENIDTAVVKTAWLDPLSGLQIQKFDQYYKGIRVLNAVNNCVFRNDALLYSRSTFITNISSRTPSADTIVSVLHAINVAEKYLGLQDAALPVLIDNRFIEEKIIVYSSGNIAKQNIHSELVWVAGRDSSIHLAWNINIDARNSADYWNVQVDAHDGSVVGSYNYTLYENADEHLQSATLSSFNVKKQRTSFDASPVAASFAPPATVISASYNVIPFPAENVFNGNISIETDPWKKAGSSNNATTNGWHYDGITNYSYTRGNNVYAYDDSLGINQPGRSDTSSTTGAVLTFNNTPDPAQQPTTTANRRFATDNLFYWCNIMHDVFYQYGFNESTGNFQKDNLGRGQLGTSGVNGNDAVLAEAQDGSGINNANFSTPPDGQPGRMQMYLFNAVNGRPLSISSPSQLARTYVSPESAFSANNLLLKKGPVTGKVVIYNDDESGNINFACTLPANTIAGKIALISRGGPAGCNAFVNKVKLAQRAGAIAVIMADSVMNGTPFTMGGSDNSITIPAVMVSGLDGQALMNAIKNGDGVTATLSAPLQFDGDLDNGVITHEYTHGISNRLTGTNSSCLTNYEQGGEGWSDYVALMMTTDWSKAKLTDGNIPRPVGVYVNAQQRNGNGIRTYPYTTDMTINPHTYANVSNNGSHPRTDDQGNRIAVATEVHYIGEIWCAALWDMTWNMIEQEGNINSNIYDANGSGGNVKALKLVIMGMQLQGCSPGFLDARNAILKADSLLFGNVHKCAIWKAFARRGMGYSAVQGSSNNTTDQTAAFDVPQFVIPGINISNAPSGGICPDTRFTFTSGTVNGGSAPQYQWTRNSTVEPGATGAAFTSNNFKNKDTIRCILTTSVGCAVSLTVVSGPSVITVNPAPAVSVTPAGPLNFCAGDSAVLVSTSSNRNQWYLNGTSINGAAAFSFIAKTSGSYTDSITGTNGCKGGSNAVIVIMNALPGAPIITQKNDTLISSAVNGNQWYLNNNMLVGAIDQKYKIINSGTYTVKVTDGQGCRSAVSASFSVVITALSGIISVNQKDWTLSPNPVNNGRLHIHHNGSLIGNAQAQIVNTDGKIVDELTIGIDSWWNVAKLSSGNYWLRIIEKKNVSVYSFIKE